MRTIYADEIRKILENHYEWCKKNGRDTSWYGKYKRVTTRKKVNVRVETS
jgi:hypothetical protein